MTDIKQAIQELKPCPFCGGEATIIAAILTRYIEGKVK